MPITSLNQLDLNGTYSYADYVSVFVRDAGTGRYQLAGEYAQPGFVPCATLPGLELNWSDIFPGPVK